MTPTEEFQEKIKAGDIFDALTLAMSEAMELKVTTWVSSSDAIAGDRPEPGAYLRTSINLVEGKINNEIGSQFLGDGPYHELREFHLEQVKEGREIILKNLESLQKMFLVLSDTVSQLEPNPSQDRMLP